jgi:hypothetical protein
MKMEKRVKMWKVRRKKGSQIKRWKDGQRETTKKE